MKKFVSSIILGAMLVTGLFLVANATADELAVNGERHPPIFMPTFSDEVEQ
ncbi:hypothetical protein [Oceanobacillus sp. FSL H7-0719]|uniref:hypothetical protein n=1 Tax=Oceanobacillus sp. FSL H7-0719 TaxID=2954507 RepID=UPI0032508A50